MTRLKVMHAGIGGWGSIWETHAIPRVPEIERVAIVDPAEPLLRAAQERHQLRDDQCYTDLGEALARVECDAVILTVPMHVHVPAAITALDAGKHVLVEKPFAGSVAEAKTAVDLAAARGLVLQVSQNYRFYPAPRTVARLLQEQRFGPVSTITTDFRKYANGRPVEGNRHYRYVHPLIYDMAIHHFDLLRLITGQEPVSVWTKTMDPPWSNFQDEASATIVVTMADGVIWSYRGSWISSGEETHWGGDWHIECKDGEIRFMSRQDDAPERDRLWLRPLGKKATRRTPDPLELWGRAGGMRAFARAIASGEEPETSGRRNLGSVALMEAAARSAASGREEAVIDPWA